MRRRLLIAHVVTVHLVLALVLWRSDALPRLQRVLGLAAPPEPTEHYGRMRPILDRIDAQAPDGAVVLLGDSIVQGYHAAALGPDVVNLGVGTDTTAGLLDRLADYGSPARARAIVVSVGHNDLRLRDDAELLENWGDILSALPCCIPLVCVAILPVDETASPDLAGFNARTRGLAEGMAALCTERLGTVFLDMSDDLADADGNLADAFHDGDGIHLSPAGYAVWTRALAGALPSP